MTSYDSSRNAVGQSLSVNGSLARSAASVYSSRAMTEQTVPDALGRHTLKTYGSAGRELTQRAAYWTAGAAMTTFGYTDGNRTSLLDPVGGLTLWTYDSLGRE